MGYRTRLIRALRTGQHHDFADIPEQLLASDDIE